MSRQPVRPLGWKPPGHIEDPPASDGGLIDLVDMGDPARNHIMITLARLRALKVDLTEDIVRNAIQAGQRSYALAVDVNARRRDLKPLSDATIAAAERAVVYYARIGNRVKIGFTTKLAERLKVINPEELLTIEPGGYELEQERHRQFCRLRTHGEWFKLEGPLVQWIDQLRGGDSLSVSA